MKIFLISKLIYILKTKKFKLKIKIFNYITETIINMQVIKMLLLNLIINFHNNLIHLYKSQLKLRIKN